MTARRATVAVLGAFGLWTAVGAHASEGGAGTPDSSAGTPGLASGTPGDRGATAVAASVAAGAGGAGSDSEAATARRLAGLRKKVLTDDDFLENDETNRDPFRSYMHLFAEHGQGKTRKIPALFERVGLEELTLIAIVSGDDDPRAMFRDATGFGLAVKPGDFLSRSGARVSKILSDRVIVEQTETRESGEPRVVERAIFVNPGGAP
jgi:Tfp pilus assembly protein PilP